MEKHGSDVGNAVKAAMPDTGATDPRSSDVEDVEIDSWNDDGGAPEPAGTQSEGCPGSRRRRRSSATAGKPANKGRNTSLWRRAPPVPRPLGKGDDDQSDSRDAKADCDYH